MADEWVEVAKSDLSDESERDSSSALSLWSTDSFLSIGSTGSVLSIGSVGSAASLLSIGSAASFASVMSAASRYSVMAAGGSGRVMGRSLGKYAIAVGAAVAVTALVAGVLPALHKAE